MSSFSGTTWLHTPVFVLLLLIVQIQAAPAHGECTSNGTEYDFIIVGGGTAGLALATRLSQRLDDCILVLEAGPSALNETRINVPGLKGSTIGTKYDWNFTTVPQPSFRGRVLPTTRGKVLGGSSALNLLAWDRGAVPDYDAWEQLGNPGWNYTTMIKAMLKAENFTATNTSANEYAGAGHSGPIDAVVDRVVPTQQDYWIPTLQNLGLPYNLEPLDGYPLGVFYQPSSIDPTDYVRSYSANGYLPLARSNLHVMDNTRVAKVEMVSRHGKLTATGIRLEDGSIISARKEVILSAGSVQSPGLLELSGIGQPAILAAAGIPTLLNLSGVGENLQDHLRVQTSYQLKPNYTSFDLLNVNSTYAAMELALYNANQVSEYDYTGSGYSYMTWSQVLGNDSDLVALARQSNDGSAIDQRKLEYLTTNDSNKVAQLEVIFSDGYTGIKGYPAKSSPLYGQQFFTLIAAIQHPFSRGSIHINSSSIDTKPVINPNYGAKEYDIQSLVEAAKYNRKIATTYPLSQAWVSEYEPGLDVVSTDAEWRDYVLNTTVSIYHPLGTCAMLPEKDGGVVDPSLLVYGTRNLRVVDSSVIPILPSGHLQTLVYGIAEMAADIVVEKWSGRRD